MTPAPDGPRVRVAPRDGSVGRTGDFMRRRISTAHRRRDPEAYSLQSEDLRFSEYLFGFPSYMSSDISGTGTLPDTYLIATVCDGRVEFVWGLQACTLRRASGCGNKVAFRGPLSEFRPACAGPNRARLRVVSVLGPVVWTGRAARSTTRRQEAGPAPSLPHHDDRATEASCTGGTA